MFLGSLLKLVLTAMEKFECNREWLLKDSFAKNSQKTLCDR